MLVVSTRPPRELKDHEGRHIAWGFDVPFGPPGNPETVYKFRATAKDGSGEQVCEVTDEEHLAVFASIPEAYDLRPTPDSPIPADEKKADAAKQANAVKQAKEKELLAKASAKGRELRKQRELKARQEQERLDRAAEVKRKRAKENKGKGKEGVDPENSFETTIGAGDSED